jgi:hypothetical protein
MSQHVHAQVCSSNCGMHRLEASNCGPVLVPGHVVPGLECPAGSSTVGWIRSLNGTCQCPMLVRQKEMSGQLGLQLTFRCREDISLGCSQRSSASTVLISDVPWSPH